MVDNNCKTLTVEEIQIIEKHLVAFGREDEQGDPVKQLCKRVHVDVPKAVEHWNGKTGDYIQRRNV